MHPHPPLSPASSGRSPTPVTFLPPTGRILLRPPDPLSVFSLLRRTLSPSFFLLHTYLVCQVFYRPVDALPFSA